MFHTSDILPYLCEDFNDSVFVLLHFGLILISLNSLIPQIFFLILKCWLSQECLELLSIWPVSVSSTFSVGWSGSVFSWGTSEVVQSLSHVWLFAPPWTAACQASLSFTISWSLLKFMSLESVMPSNHLILCHPFSSCLQSFPASFPSSLHQVDKVLELHHQSFQWIQDWFPLELTTLISLQSKGLSRVFSSTTVRKHQFFGTQPSLWFNSHFHPWLLKNP